MPKTIVVSAVNLRKGGTLTILRQCLSYLSEFAQQEGHRIVALVHKQELADYPNIEYIELPWCIEGWSKRLWAEYVSMGKISRQIGKIDLWLSLHDTTPRVEAKRQAVYCHTSFPFLKLQWQDLRFDLKIPLFSCLTRFAYQFGIQRNRHIIVQQEWFRDGFKQLFGLPHDRIIVAPAQQTLGTEAIRAKTSQAPYTFFFASTPDSHKNFETLAKATQLLTQRLGAGSFRTILTISGEENKYSRWIKTQWGNCPNLELVGLLEKPDLYGYYTLADCFVFPSRIETWGLPISEYMHVKGNAGHLLLSDLPYAHETSRGAEHVAFFPPTDAEYLAEAMQKAMQGDRRLWQSNPAKPIASPYAPDWHSLFEILLKD